jgi:hypothetical protein
VGCSAATGGEGKLKDWMKKAEKAVKNAIPYNFRIVQCSISFEKVRRAKRLDFPGNSAISSLSSLKTLGFKWERGAV